MTPDEQRKVAKWQRLRERAGLCETGAFDDVAVEAGYKDATEAEMAEQDLLDYIADGEDVADGLSAKSLVSSAPAGARWNRVFGYETTKWGLGMLEEHPRVAERMLGIGQDYMESGAVTDRLAVAEFRPIVIGDLGVTDEDFISHDDAIKAELASGVACGAPDE